MVDSGEPAEFEVQVPALNHRCYEARASRIASDQFSVMFVEITQRKAAESELLRSSERYRTLFNSIDEGFCILELLFDDRRQPVDYRFVEINPAFERQSGLAGATGRTIRELVPDIEGSWISTYAGVALTGESIRFESHAGALGRWFDAFAFRIGEEGQNRVALLFTDITERKLAQDALAVRESELREAQQLAGTGSWFWNPVEDGTDASPELLRMLGYRDGETLPSFEMQRGTIYPADEWERLNAAAQQTLAGHGPYSIDLKAFRKGEPIWVTARGSLVQGHSGEPLGLRGTLQDITERKQIEHALRAADERKNEFLATLAHELRNPLAPLRNGLSILNRVDATSQNAIRARELMDRQLTNLVRLVDDLLDVSRVSQGKIVLQKSGHTLESLVDLAVETSRPLIEGAGHHLSVVLPIEPVLMMVDSTRIAQVLSNILNNAAKYTPAGGEIRLRGELAGSDRISIAIEDTGVGIPPDMLESIFDLFTQVGDANGLSQGGLGIGLSLARRLVELHGGTVRASSAGKGRGSTFSVELPIMQRVPDEEALGRRDPTGASAHRRGKAILVVDDNVDAAETLAMLLDMDGHLVTVAHSGQTALAALTESVPDIAFLDIGLGDMSGYDVARELRSRKELASTVLVALTGWGAERDQQRARAAGFDMHLTKPVRMEDVSKALASHRAEANDLRFPEP